MIIYVRCPSCGRILSENFDKYLEERESIRKDPNKKPSEKELASANLLDKYGYKNICCRMRVMGTIPAHEIIQT